MTDNTDDNGDAETPEESEPPEDVTAGSEAPEAEAGGSKTTTERDVDVPLSDLRRSIESRRRGRKRSPRRGEDSETAGDAASSQAGRDEDAGGRAATGPLAGLREDLAERRRKRRTDKTEAEEAFQQAGSEPVLDGEQVWEDLLHGQDEEAGVLAFGEEVEGEAEDVRIIPDRVCHSCRYFGDPPELHCTHDGTTIRRVVDMEHYEVVECPVVKNRSDLQGR